MSIIGVLGYEGSGKTTICNWLVKQHNYIEVALAAPLKEIVSIIYGFDMEMLLGVTPESRVARVTEKDPIWNLTGREALEYLGTDILRKHMDPDIWLKIAFRKIEKLLAEGKSVVISDIRFWNEYSFFSSDVKKYPVCFIYVYRNYEDLEITEKDRQSHISKWQCKEIYQTRNFSDVSFTHALIHNDRTIDSLHKKIDNFMLLIS